MGGRLDATNVLDLGVAAITNVQLDHEAYLGHTLSAIGAEKAPIIKRGNLAVTGACGRGLRPILDRSARARRPAAPRRPAPAVPGAPGAERLGRHRGRCSRRRTASFPGCEVGLLGRHQAQNAAVALALLDALGRALGPRRRRGDACVAGWRRRAGPAGSSCSTARASACAASCSTEPTTRPAPRHWRRALGDLGLRRPTIVFGAMRGKKRPRRPARAGSARAALRLHPRRRCRRARPGRSARAWRRVSGRPTGHAWPRRRAEGARSGRRRRPDRRGRLALPRRRRARHDHRDGEEA